MQTNRIVTGDSFDVLPDLEDESVHAVVTDPPYGLAFMGRDWDDFEPRGYQDWCMEWAAEVKRVLKPGGHLLAFSGNRTHHRLFTGVEDAGFEIRDTLTWHYGSGFPKASDVSKVIDKRAFQDWLDEHPQAKERLTGLNPGSAEYKELERELKQRADAEREVTGTKEVNPMPQLSPRDSSGVNETDGTFDEYGDGVVDITEPPTDAAKEWDGWKTGLKPATEFVVMARTPFEGATVDCVLEHGTGALNIDGVRIGTDEDTSRPSNGFGTSDDLYGTGDMDGEINKSHTEGRYPANVVFHEGEAERLDAKNEHVDGGRAGNGYEWKGSHAMRGGMSGGASDYDDHGGPSRYYYTSKASRSERTQGGSIPNDHPTVKPLDLMEWLVRLITREGQIVLDPFAGSGTTCRAAKDLGREFIGIEKSEQWADVARARVGLTVEEPSTLTDEQQATLADGGFVDAAETRDGET